MMIMGPWKSKDCYGPPLYHLTAMVLLIRLFLSLLWGRFEASKLKRDQVAVLDQAVDAYNREFERFITFMSEVFANSPFFIPAEIAGTLQGSSNDEFKEICVPAGKTHEISLVVDAINSYVAWDFSLTQGAMNVDIGFSVEYMDASENKTGNFCTIQAGNYKLIWDNSYSAFFKKVLRYKVECIPPVVEPEKSTNELEG